MTILAIGGTGQIGSLVVRRLADERVDVVVMTQRPEAASVPAGVRLAKGDGLDPAATRAALKESTRCSSSTPSCPTN